MRQDGHHCLASCRFYMTKKPFADIIAPFAASDLPSAGKRLQTKKRPFRVMKRKADAFTSGFAPREESKMRTKSAWETALLHAMQ